MSDFLKFLYNHLPTIISCGIIAVVGLILIKIFDRLARRTLDKSKINSSMHKFILTLNKITLLIILTVVILQTAGIEMTAIVAVISVAGLAVSLAVQDSLANVAGGIIILFTKPFEADDFVKIDDIEGNVRQIGIINTKISTLDNKAVFIPNSLIAAGKVINYSRDKKRRLDLTFSVSYSDDFELAKKIILEVIDKNPLALKDPKPTVRVNEYSQSSIDIVAFIWVYHENYFELKYSLLEGVKPAFDKNNISIPFNKLDVNIVSK